MFSLPSLFFFPYHWSDLHNKCLATTTIGMEGLLYPAYHQRPATKDPAPQCLRYCQHPHPPTHMALNIVSFNVNGLNHLAKRALVWREALKLLADVLCIQETHLSASNTPHFQHKKFPHIFLASAPTKQKGVSIAIRDSVAFTLKETHTDPINLSPL